MSTHLLELNWNTNNRIYINKGDWTEGQEFDALGWIIVVGIDEFKDSFACDILCKICKYFSLSRNQQLFKRVGIRITYLEETRGA